ncbi:MAG: MarR family transcriptional regulator [Acidimicrobiaceae bacterium]|nr:MarR family transcriptional regulator [Acidimicrobiaceae bacterium]
MTQTPLPCTPQDERVALFSLLLETNARLARSLASQLEEHCRMPLAFFEVLMELDREPTGRLKMTQVAEAIVHSSGGTTRLVDRMVEATLVERQQCPSDRRAVHVAITDEGRRRLDEALTVHLNYLDEVLSGRLDCAERTTLATLLAKLNDVR